ncbi:hypothetical protein BGI40_07335 [Snodgrassella communis]|uniref:SIR2-like domain-containing protein n=1 Tax=Snodgrassella communis TaxID=2946699 RepID=A0A836Z6G5_9NEIS|nr:SIR2 family protein [Snodgrassella communis]KDN15805.1 hypothetical protein SALWKB29_0224 [Snodgrassella communis]PIT11994.1 hypothetical protein BGI29_02835 [Snodgrassella communis]PIT28978.1 hypothetical protein BGI39_04350 [Snodgrassella communis]PIT29961.1 hypothetical protein BGI38_02385 [Snodgrassella communis]PIT33479.1 hypothetical protein BGI40_07335 [Snodgrassella communis]
MGERDITKITDYPLIQKLAQSLWQRETYGHGVAIMVGAGFSRSAATTMDKSKALPLWGNLAKKIAGELGESEQIDPLRLAQMYQDYFGKQQLYDLLKNEIDDEIWEPAELYQQLLTLPWTEVLTTNWDTLLERAARNIHEPIYDIVSKQEDLASCYSPRIVKLHGTINISNDLIFTQEDYRCYPQKYGIFVNFVRQVFVENELCLIGFSGDDPNFLQWIGWVRDNLQTNVRRIYLVGALNLSSAKRKYLESLNVAPIDLSPLVADIDNRDLQHKIAIELFLSKLSQLEVKKFWDWQPTSLYKLCNDDSIDMVSGKVDIAPEEILSALIKDRESYPEWIICPDSLRSRINVQISKLRVFISDLSELNETTRSRVLYELVWRCEIIFHYNMDKDFRTMLLAICDPASESGISKKQQLEIALYLLKYTRLAEKNSEQQEIISKTSKILKENSEYWSESLVELAYHQILVARDELNYPLMEELLDKINGVDPIWKLRKAFILSEIALYEESANLIDKAYQELVLSYRNNRNSIFILSRLAWAHLLKSVADKALRKNNVLEFFSSKYSQQKCDPFDTIYFLRSEVSDYLEKQKKPMIEPSFEPGRFKDNSKKVHFTDLIKIHPAILFDSVGNTVGLPIRWCDYAYTSNIAFDIANLIDISNWQRFFLLIHITDDDKSEQLRKIFTRLKIAQMPYDEADKIVQCCFNAIGYWTDKRINIPNSKQQEEPTLVYLRVFIEILARFQVRLSPDDAKKYYSFALELAKDQHCIYLCLKNSINNLLNYSLKSIPTAQHNELLVDALDFPNTNNWLNPVIHHPGERKEDKELDLTIDFLINNVLNEKQNSKLNIQILDRLLPLIETGFLSEDERSQLVSNIYGQNFDYKQLPYINEVYPSFFLKIPPEEDTKQICSLIQNEVFSEQPSDDLIFLNKLINTLLYTKDGLIPSKKQAIDYFDYFTSCKHNKYSNDLGMIFMGIDSNTIARYICQILYYLSPYLPKEFLNQNNFDKLYRFYLENDASPYIIRAFIPFVLIDAQWNEQIITMIKKGLKSKVELVVGDAAYAILDWGSELSDKTVIRPLIDKLIYRVESARLIGLINILPVINEMLNKDWLTKQDINVLIENLPEIYTDSSYINFNDEDSEAITISGIRVACVKLARDILKRSSAPIPELQNILEEARNDALPEVRFAELDEYFE